MICINLIKFYAVVGAFPFQIYANSGIQLSYLDNIPVTLNVKSCVRSNKKLFKFPCNKISNFKICG